jgi:drug/metabolite transporter (DMT)-like permease
MFKRKNLLALLGNFAPNFLILLSLTLAFKYAALGGLNQGVLPTLTCLASIFTMVLFYFTFYELISLVQFLGMLVMVISVVFLGLEAMNKGQTDDIIGVDGQDRSTYNLMALGFATLAPVFITVKSYCIRLFADEYNSFDMGIDGLIFEHLSYSIIFVVYIQKNPVSSE